MEATNVPLTNKLTIFILHEYLYFFGVQCTLENSPWSFFSVSQNFWSSVKYLSRINTLERPKVAIVTGRTPSWSLYLSIVAKFTCSNQKFNNPRLHYHRTRTHSFSSSASHTNHFSLCHEWTHIIFLFQTFSYLMIQNLSQWHHCRYVFVLLKR